MLSKKRGSKQWGPLPFFCELTRSAKCSRRVIVIRGDWGASISTCQGEELRVSMKGNQAPIESFLLRKTGFKQCWRKIILATVCKIDHGIESVWNQDSHLKAQAPVRSRWGLSVLPAPIVPPTCWNAALDSRPVSKQPLPLPFGPPTWKPSLFLLFCGTQHILLVTSVL